MIVEPPIGGLNNAENILGYLRSLEFRGLGRVI